ncbi:MAG: GvpL/GvpF family gas vesicle protein [candidate division Zixibacteria bacterium]|nr:GvpL/GvpF family gas vesicle protein [candidate division Zixibacteria bacterium]
MTKNIAKDFQQPLTRIEGKEEWKVKIYANLKRMREYISKNNTRLEEEKLIQDKLHRKLNESKQKTFGWMKKQAEEARLDEILPQESNQKKSAGSIGKTMVLNSTYLVSKEDRENFARVVRFLEKEYKSMGLSFESTGPKVPYNFLSAK